MIYWYADDSKFKSLPTLKDTDVFLFGGCVIDDKNVFDLKNRIESIKARFIDPRIPVKWNLKDLRKFLENKGFYEEYTKLINSSDLIRGAIINETSDIDYKIIFSAVEIMKDEFQLNKELSNNFERYAFSYSLNQFAWLVKEQNVPAQIILDWPNGSDNRLFSEEFGHAYSKGKSASGKFKYNCGHLKNLNFSDTPYYANSHYSTLLQFTDLLLGITKDFLMSKVNTQKFNNLANSLFPIIEKKFRGYPQYEDKGLYIPRKSFHLRNAVFRNNTLDLTF